jgi:1-pyrroline-4-hydroxy-2-carboxylate deaminase
MPASVAARPMSKSDWNGVIPAITTPFNPDLTIDHAFLARHAAWMVDHGCVGIVSHGSLGEGATLSHEEKFAILSTLISAVGSRVPVIAAVSALSTAEAVRIARDARAAGCRGLMVLPPYVYRGDWRETKAHFSAVIGATDLSCMLYNNPIAYGTDTTPEQIAELAAEHANLHAVKESSADVRRLTAIRALIADRLSLLVGVDDLIVEGVAAGATGWIAGLVNAMPAESVRLFTLAQRALVSGDWSKVHPLYAWFLPLLRLDVVPEFVHLIKLAQQEVAMGSERVRPPRLELVGPARERALATIRAALRDRPTT